MQVAGGEIAPTPPLVLEFAEGVLRIGAVAAELPETQDLVVGVSQMWRDGIAVGIADDRMSVNPRRIRRNL